MRTTTTGVKRSVKIAQTPVLTESRGSTCLSVSELCCGDVQPSQIVVRSRRLRELTVDGGRKTRSQTPSMLEKVTYGAPREPVKTARRTFSIASITEDTYLVCRSTLGPACRAARGRPLQPTVISGHLAGRPPRRSGFGAAAPRAARLQLRNVDR
jgi:hypothetical protein